MHGNNYAVVRSFGRRIESEIPVIATPSVRSSFVQLASQVKSPPVSSVPAYDLMFRRHPDLTHLRLLAYRFFQRIRASEARNEELEDLWRRPGLPKPIYTDAKYLVGTLIRLIKIAQSVYEVTSGAIRGPMSYFREACRATEWANCCCVLRFPCLMLNGATAVIIPQLDWAAPPPPAR